MTIDEYRTLGRITGADIARTLVDALAGSRADAAQLAAAAEAAIRQRMRSLSADGASEEEIAAFAESAERRYFEVLEEIALHVELGMLAEDGPSGGAN